MGGQGLSALAFLIVVLRLAQPPPAARSRSSCPAHFHDLGNLMLAFVMLWAYFSFSQFLIIWSGNLPEEIAVVPAPARRPAGGCVGARADRCSTSSLPFVAAAVARRQARAPRCWSRSRSAILLVRARRPVLADRAGVPPRRHRRSAGSTSCCRCRSAALWLGCFVWQLRGRAILPVHDPQFDEALGRIIERGASRRGRRTEPWPTSRTTRRRAPRPVHHETSDVNIRADPRLRRRR